MIYDSTYHHNKSYFVEPILYGDVYLIQIGRLYSKPSNLIPLHVHTNYYELTIVTDGKGTITTNGVSSPVEKGDIYLSLPCDSHGILSDDDEPLKYDFFAFTCTDKEKQKELEIITERFYSPTSRIFKSESIRNLVSHAIAELDENKEYSKELIECYFKEIVIKIIRNFTKIIPERTRLNVTDAEVLCYKLMNYIDTHVYSMKSLGELSAVADYSYGYLSSVFKKTTGNNLSDYYREKRLEASKILLTENRLKITEISEMLGYSTVYAFSKAFFARFGISPREYRKEKN